MAAGSNQKQKLLYLMRIFQQETDESHGLTVPEIISRLNKEDISADRKTLYLDIEELKSFGLDITSEHKGRSVIYKLISRDFELAELKLLVDSVQASKFISDKKSRELIKKLESLVSCHDARKLNGQVILSGRVKTMNSSVYYSVDAIHDAINRNRKIRFQYFQWNVKKQPELRHGGAFYTISPWALVWNNENYYLIGYDSAAGILKHFRVDKMKKLSVEEPARDGKEIFDKLDLPSYSKSLFGMYGGDTVNVTLLCENSHAGTIIDRFGSDVIIVPEDEGHFTVTVNVSASSQFLGWVVGLGKGVKIIAPESVVELMRREALRLSEQYLPQP